MKLQYELCCNVLKFGVGKASSATEAAEKTECLLCMLAEFGIHRVKIVVQNTNSTKTTITIMMIKQPTLKTRSVPDLPRNPRLIGWPQCGQLSAWRLTELPHDGHFVRAILYWF